MSAFRNSLPTEEQALWCAAYAAAFVSQFDRLRAFRDTFHGVRDRMLPIEESCSAEDPIYIADLAVRKLREWKVNE